MSLISSIIKYTVIIIVIIGLGYVVKKSIDKGLNIATDLVPDMSDITKNIDEIVNGIISDTNGRDELIKNQKTYLLQIKSALEIMNQKLDKIESQLKDIYDELQSLRLEAKFHSFYETLVNLKSLINIFPKTIDSYGFNDTRLYTEIGEYFKLFRSNDYEGKIIAYLEISGITNTAPIEQLIKVLKKKSQLKFFELKSSTNKFIFDFYSDLMVVVNTAGTSIINYYELESKIKNENIGDINFVNTTLKTNNEKLMKSMISAMSKVNSSSDIRSFMDLQRAEFELKYSSFSKCYVGKMEAAKGFVVTGVRFRVNNGILFLEIQTGQLISFGIVNQTTVQWQGIPSESEIDKKDIIVLLNRKEQLDTHGSCTFTDEMVTGIQLKYNVRVSTMKFNVKIFGKDRVSDCETDFAPTTQLVDVTVGADTFQLPKESKAGGTYDGNDIYFEEFAPISGVGFYSYAIKDSDEMRHRPYIFSLNYGMILKTHEGFLNKHGQSIQSQKGFYTQMIY